MPVDLEEGAIVESLQIYTPEWFAYIREVARAVRDPKTPKAQWAAWAIHADEMVRATLLGSPLIASTLAAQIARGSLSTHGGERRIEEYVIAACARMPSRILREVYNEHEWLVCIALANNPKTPNDLLEKLSILPEVPSGNIEDKNKEVRHVAKSMLQRKAKARPKLRRRG